MYDDTKRTTTVTDRTGTVSVLTFPASPFPDGAAPEQVVITADRTLDPAATDRTYRLHHNRDGLRVSLTEPSGVVTEHVYDETNTDPRARGNLRALIHRSTTGEQRIASWVYEPRYNFPMEMVEPRGHAPGSSVAMYTTRLTYDHQLGTGDHGNLVRIMRPRALSAVIAPTPSGGRQLRWIDENPTIRLEHNTFGLVTSETDEQGVVTDFTYHPESDPGGAAGAAAAATGGGWLASATRDARTTTTRDQHLEGVPLDPQTATWRYTALGDLFEEEDATGVTTRFDRDSLRGVVKITEAIRVRGTGPSPRITNVTYNEHGSVARVEAEQPHADAWAGGAKIFCEWDYDERGNIKAARVKLHAGSGTAPDVVLGESVARTPADVPEQVTAGDGRAAKLAFDERGLLGRVVNAPAWPSPPTTTLRRSADGDVHEGQGPAGDPWTGHEDAFGEPEAVIDPLGGVVRDHPDEGGARTRRAYAEPTSPSSPVRTFPPPPGAGVVTLTEHRIDELGRAGRRHDGLLPATGGAPSGTTPGPQAPEYLGPVPPGWPPGALQTFADGAWGPGDGRRTSDVSYDPCGRPTRHVDDALGVTWVRRDAYGRPYEWSTSQDDVAPNFNLVTERHDIAARTVETRAQDHASDPLHPLTRSFPVREEYDEHGALVRWIDGEGSAWRYEYDERGVPLVLYDPLAPDGVDPPFNGHAINLDGEETRFAYDGLGRLTDVIVPLTKANPAGIGRVPDANAYNADAKVWRHWGLDAGGRLASSSDRDVNTTVWAYDDAGRPWKVTHPPSAATAGADAVHELIYDGAVLRAIKDAVGTEVRFEPTGGGRPQRMSWTTLGAGVAAEPKGWDLEHDGRGHIVLARDLTTSREVRAVYDSASGLRSETQGGLTVATDYDGAGRPARLTYPNGEVVEYHWDRSGRLREVVDRGEVIRLEYLGTRRLQSRTHNGVTARWAYTDGAGRLAGIEIEGLAQPAKVAFAVTPDRRGRIADWARTDPTGTQRAAFTFDSAGRIVTDVYEFSAALALFPSSAITRLSRTRLFDGDDVVRELRDEYGGPAVPPPTTHHQIREERGRITKIDFTTLTYDRNGHMLRDHRGQRHVWDAFGRLAKVELPGGALVVAYRYDHLGRLVARTDASGEEQFVYDGWRVIEVRRGGQVRERYVWGRAGELLVAELGGTRYTVLAAPDGSVDCLVDPQRRVVERYVHTAFGSTIVLDAAGQVLTAPRLRFLFKTRMWDQPAGLIHFGLRWYSPDLEQFLIPDPLGPSQGPNHYALCWQDPVNRRDPLGLGPLDEIREYVTEGFRQGGLTIYGAGSAVAGVFVEPGLQLADLFGVAPSRRWRPRSGLGRAAEASPYQGLTVGDSLLTSRWLFYETGRGIVTTPARFKHALERADTIAVGREAMNLYMLGRPVFRGVASLTVNNAIRRLSWLGPRGLALRTRIRTWQLDRVRPAVQRLLGFRDDPARPLRYDAAGDASYGRFSTDGSPYGVASVFEGAFATGLQDVHVWARNLLDWSCTGPMRGRYALFHRLAGAAWLRANPLGWLRLWKGAPSLLEAAMHESFHGWQYAMWASAYEALSGTRQGFFGILEFTDAVFQMNEPTYGTSWETAGAHDFALHAAPPAWLSPAALVHHLPLAYATNPSFRR